MSAKRSLSAYVSAETMTILDTYAQMSRRSRHQALEDLIRFAILGYGAFPDEERAVARITLDAVGKRLKHLAIDTDRR